MAKNASRLAKLNKKLTECNKECFDVYREMYSIELIMTRRERKHVIQDRAKFFKKLPNSLNALINII